MIVVASGDIYITIYATLSLRQLRPAIFEAAEVQSVNGDLHGHGLFNEHKAERWGRDRGANTIHCKRALRKEGMAVDREGPPARAQSAPAARARGAGNAGQGEENQDGAENAPDIPQSPRHRDRIGARCVRQSANQESMSSELSKLLLQSLLVIIRRS
jgi:hypothetical protein